MANRKEEEQIQIVAETVATLVKNQAPKHDWFPGLSEKHRQELLRICTKSLKERGLTDEEINHETDPQEAKIGSLNELRMILNGPKSRDVIHIALDELPRTFFLRLKALVITSPEVEVNVQDFMIQFLREKISPQV